jgi:hypothetical protein
MVVTTNTLESRTPRFLQHQNDWQANHHDTLGAPWSAMDFRGHTKDYLETKGYLKM